jgi:hypothetical protein
VAHVVHLELFKIPAEMHFDRLLLQSATALLQPAKFVKALMFPHQLPLVTRQLCVGVDADFVVVVVVEEEEVDVFFVELGATLDFDVELIDVLLDEELIGVELEDFLLEDTRMVDVDMEDILLVDTEVVDVDMEDSLLVDAGVVDVDREDMLPANEELVDVEDAMREELVEVLKERYQFERSVSPRQSPAVTPFQPLALMRSKK